MLVLSRHLYEEIVIDVGDSQIVISVVDIRGDKVRIGIQAPDNVPVHRREVYEAIRREGQRRKAIKRSDNGSPRGNHNGNHNDNHNPSPNPNPQPESE